MTTIGIFLLRVKRPDAERPYRAFGYPFVPALYILAAAAIMLVLLLYQTQTSGAGLVIVLIGLPVYFLWSWWSKRVAPVRDTEYVNFLVGAPHTTRLQPIYSQI